MTGAHYRFEPDWCIHPGETLRAFFAEPGYENVIPRLFAHACGLPVRTIERLIACDPKQHITKDTAERLHRGLKAIGGSPSPQFWLNLDRTYHAGLKRGCKDITDPS